MVFHIADGVDHQRVFMAVKRKGLSPVILCPAPVDGSVCGPLSGR